MSILKNLGLKNLKRQLYNDASILDLKTGSLIMNDVYADLKQQFYAQVPWPLKSAVLNEAIKAFFNFLDLPLDIKNHIDYSIAPLHRRGSIGYKRRESDEHIYNDNKDFFHYHPSIFERYPDFIKSQPVIEEFLNQAKPIWEQAYQTFYSILSKFEADFPKLCDKVFNIKDVHMALRFLKYDWQNSGHYLAKPHFDAGSFTLAIAESTPGLRIGSKPDDLKLVSHSDEHAIFMLSSNFKKVIATEELHAGWHDVIQLDKSLIGQPFARWAVVAFLEVANVEAQPRSMTHKFYQGVL